MKLTPSKAYQCVARHSYFKALLLFIQCNCITNTNCWQETHSSKRRVLPRNNQAPVCQALPMNGYGMRTRSVRPRTRMLSGTSPGTALVTVEQDTGNTAVSVMYGGDVNQTVRSSGDEIAVFV